MRALRLLALAAALVVPAAAAHAELGVYVAPTPVYAAGWVPGHWEFNAYGRFWVPAHRIPGYGVAVGPAFGPYHRDLYYDRFHRDDRFRGGRW